MRYKSQSLFNRVPNRPIRSVRPKPITSRPRRARDWVATLIMFLMLPALAIPIVASLATDRTVVVSPSSIVAGNSVSVRGSGFAINDSGLVYLDGAKGSAKRFRTDAAGSFTLTLIIPETAAVGRHVVSVQPRLRTVRTMRVEAVASTAILMVVQPSSDATGSPSTYPIDLSGPTSTPSSMPIPPPVPTEAPTPIRALALELPPPPATPPPATPPPATPPPATPPPATPPPATPPPVAPPPPSVSGNALYIAPNGNDANPCSVAAPCLTILSASGRLLPGDTLLVRGGTYTGQGGYNWQSSGTPGAPVTIRAYPGESPTFDGAGWSHGIIVAGYSNVIIDGLAFTGFGKGPTGDGTIMLLNATNITIQNTWISNTGTDALDHSIYVNSGTNFITIRNNTLINSTGTHIVLNHAPGPTNVVIEGNAIGNPAGETAYGGVVVACTATGTTATVSGNVFRGITINNIQICGGAGASVTAFGNDPI